jgi:hypothetical protein
VVLSWAVQYRSTILAQRKAWNSLGPGIKPAVEDLQFAEEESELSGPEFVHVAEPKSEMGRDRLAIKRGASIASR